MSRKTSPWMQLDGHGYGRVLLGTDPENVANRVAFIEKTPRVRIRPDNEEYDQGRDWLNWAEAPFKGGSPRDPESVDWCDCMLVMLGYELT